MPIIRLPADVVDQIAAGEVLERPANLIKELVENSLDAHANEIEVHISRGGRELIVKDNGQGISEQDLPLAFERHATSKITQAADLWKLGSFGFRGEALASAAAVSHLTITSRPYNAAQASRQTSEFGRLTDLVSVGSEHGTTLHVTDLFGNVPARLKFLKSDSAETLQIKRTLKALGLANPQAGFRIFIDGKMQGHWPAHDLWLKRIGDVLLQRHLYETQYELSNMQVTAFFSSPNEVEKTAQNLWFFVNKRWVQDRSLQAAIMEAYRNLLMHGEYPIVAAFIKIPPDEVDVNMSPTKSQVKFADPRQVFRALHQALRGQLETAPWLKDELPSDMGPQIELSPQTHITPQQKAQKLELGNLFTHAHQHGFSSELLERTQYPKKITLETLKTLSPKSLALGEPPTSTTEIVETCTHANNQTSAQTLSIKPRWSLLEVLGQANLTYIVAQSSRGLMLIDQHAAHERINFEKLSKAWRDQIQPEVQQFLMPYTLQMDPAQIDVLLSFADRLESLGITVERGGPDSIFITSCPAYIKDSSLGTALEKLSQELLAHGDSFVMERKFSDVLATMACHSSIRAGQTLSLEEMVALLRQMDDFPLSSFCPHGRPVFVEHPFREIDTQFGRIV